MSVWELYTQLFARSWRCGRFAQSFPKGAQRSERKTLSWQQGDGRANQSRSCSSWCSGDLQSKLDLQSSQWKHASSTRPKTARQSKSTHKPDDPFFWQHWRDLHALGSHWTDSQQGILCWGFKGVQGEIPSEEAGTLQIRSVTFPPEQCTSPQLHPFHILFDQDGHQDSSSPSLDVRGS